MDWLRIAAFGLLILYHIGMVFAPWHWVIKTPEAFAWLIPPMAILTPWRLPLLFAVSGFASAKLLARSYDLGRFVGSRNRRLLVPLAFGMLVIVPVEMWVRVRMGGYPSGYAVFWLRDYWRVGDFYSVAFPSWEHLWFIAYLWVYTLVLAAVVAGGWRADRIAAWLANGHRLLWAPAAGLVVAKLALLFVVPESHSLLHDWSGHAEYGAMFAFGFVLANHPTLWPAIERSAFAALAIAVAAGAIVATIEWHHPGASVPGHEVMALDRAATIAMAWGMTIALFHAATRWLDRDHAWRAPLARAVFPAYLLHHTAIVLTTWWLLPLGLPAAAMFAWLVVAVGVTCAAGYAIGRRVGWIGTLIGMPPRSDPRAISVPRPATVG